MTIRRTLVVAAVLVAMALAPLPARAAGFEPIGLSVDGGEETWRAEPTFALRWSNPAGVAAVHYRLLDPAGSSSRETRIGWAATAVQHLTVPNVAGAYTAEVWLEDATGAEGSPVVARLRFDDSTPGNVEPSPAPPWIGRDDFPLLLRIGHPPDPQPLSGIRGYAISIDRQPDGEPCRSATVCEEAETDLRSGVEVDSLEVADLPEGINFAHAVAVSGSGVRSALAGNAMLRVDKTDPVTNLAGDPGRWANEPLTLVAGATDAGSGMDPVDGGSVPFTALRIDGGAPIVAAGDRVSATVIESGVHTVAHYARDAAGNANDGGRVNGQQSEAPRTAIVRIDREPPYLSFSNAPDPAEPERIEASAGDTLAGVDPSTGAISVRAVGSGARFEPLPTTVSGSTLSALWDSEAYPPGEYEFRAAAFDKAGNLASTTTRANGTAMRLRNPLKVPTHLRAALLRNRGGALPCKRTAAFAGRLVAGRQAPLAGAPVRVLERFAPGSRERQRLSTVWTRADGSFQMRLRPGPSREIRALSAPTATLGGARSAVSTLAVPACVSLRASSPVAEVGGRPIYFSGKVGTEKADLPAEGMPVQLQFRLPGMRWSEFRTVQTDGRGRFRYAYRFADDDSRGVRFRFRAFAAARAGWPFAPAGSATVEVRGI